MEYIVSARKYRPMTFDSVVGQNALTTTLKNAVNSGKLAHAYLFCGPRGVGKTTCARIFAKAINCQNPTADGEACNECESCKAFNEQRSYNILEFDAASNNSVEQIKQLMEQTHIPPQVGKYKVFIIDEVHMLSATAFNAFLKTLEEPPAHVIFILATTEKKAILPTILSRCQIYDFERMTVPNTIAHLKKVAEKEGITYEEQALAVIAEKADGGMRDALSIFDQAASFCQGNITYQKVIEDLNVLDSDNYFNMIDLALENKVSDIMVILNNILNKGFDAGNLVNGLAQHVRNVLMAKDEQTVSLLETSDQQRQRYQEQAKKAPTPFLYKALSILSRCDINYRQSSNKRLLVELSLIEVAQITQPDDTPSAGRRPGRLKSLFKNIMVTQPKPAAQGTGRVAPQQMATATTEPSAVVASSATPTSGTASSLSSQTASTASSGTASPVSTHHVMVQEATKSEASAVPRFKLSGIGMTFQNLRQGPQKPAYQQQAEETGPAAEVDKTFSQENLDLEWMKMCSRMPQEMAGLSSRLKNIQPTITEFPTIEIVVDNELLLDQINQIKPRIKATLAQALQNKSININARLAEQQEVHRILTRREKIEELLQSNQALAKLCKDLNLVLA